MDLKCRAENFTYMINEIGGLDKLHNNLTEIYLPKEQ